MEKRFAILNEEGIPIEWGLLETHVKYRKGLNPNKVIEYETTQQPVYDSKVYYVREISPEKTENGKWAQRWELVERPLATIKNNIKKFFIEQNIKYVGSIYPDWKKQSDIVDKESSLFFLLNINSEYTMDMLYTTSVLEAWNILEEVDTLENVLSTKPELEREYWSQLLKAIIRLEWFVKTKKALKGIEDKIESATSLNEIPFIPEYRKELEFTYIKGLPTLPSKFRV